MHHRPYGPYERFFFFFLDLKSGLAAVLVFWWLYLILALLVRVKLGSPVLFAQERPGKDEKIFTLYKFRTMTDARDEHGNLLPDEVRLTRFGKLLRATSLDELPEAFNIIKGDMSVIGPRPLLVRYLPRYSKEQHRRHEVRPGLSGYAQVMGRNSISWENRFKYDVWYVDHISLKLDLKLIFMTIKSVVRHEGITSSTSSTMEEFLGDNSAEYVPTEKSNITI